MEIQDIVLYIIPMLWIVFDFESVIESVKICITVLKSSKVTCLPADGTPVELCLSCSDGDLRHCVR